MDPEKKNTIITKGQKPGTESMRPHNYVESTPVNPITKKQ